MGEFILVRLFALKSPVYGTLMRQLLSASYLTAGLGGMELELELEQGVPQGFLRCPHS